MTYNFDPERWFENQLALLKSRKSRGEITAEEFASSRDRLVDEYEKMLDRLDVKYDYFQHEDDHADTGEKK